MCGPETVCYGGVNPGTVRGQRHVAARRISELPGRIGLAITREAAAEGSPASVLERRTPAARAPAGGQRPGGAPHRSAHTPRNVIAKESLSDGSCLRRVLSENQ